MKTSKQDKSLASFHPIIQTWFNETFPSSTLPQEKGWPAIFKNENTLILAPTGSGKTLAAFLVCINEILSALINNENINGVHTLYISPLKALNYDIERNLESPLAGIQRLAEKQNVRLPQIKVSVRTGDTPQRERQRMLKKPPHILITTPESLHLLLTSKLPREILKTVKYVIVDEIHALSENKRGTFLSVLLERLQNLTAKKFVRIGLSATQKPLEEIAKFLGGNERVETKDRVGFLPRPVTIVDAGMRKKLDLKILTPVEDFKSLPENSVWPDIYQKLLEQIQEHKTTLIFANNRAAVERITNEINERAGFELAKAHHGSVSKERRKEIEEELKGGKLSALVATATLELGIDMGSIDLVCQVESPRSVARGLQRVGRAGHLYKAASKGRLVPKTRADLLEMTVITHAMRGANVAPIHIPKNCLDILAQQIVSLIAEKSWHVESMFNLIRQAYPYSELPKAHFISVLEMLSGRYPSETFRDLRPRISWDRVNNMLHPLPGTRRAAILGGGAIPDTGQFGCYLEDGSTKIGELEEEFVYESRLGETFALGTNLWRIREITHDRVLVSPAPGETARMPFWKGEYFHRGAHLGKLSGEFCRNLAEKINEPFCLDWLQKSFDLTAEAAENLQQYFQDQLKAAGFIPDDRTILIECFPDELGDLRIVLLSPYGGLVHLPWRLAIIAQFRRQLNIEPESFHSDGGLIFRYPMENIETFLEVIRSVNSGNVEDLVLEELANSFFFGLRFRQNAGRALLMPLFHPGKRAPLWLQRMRARDLLEVTRQHPSFPIVVETYRESLQDYLAVNELKEILLGIENNSIQVKTRQTPQPSPFSSSILFEFMSGHMYNYDEPKSTSAQSEIIDRHALEELLNPGKINQLLDESVIDNLEKRLQAELEGYQARSSAELVELLRRIGDLTDKEIFSRIAKQNIELFEKLKESGQIIQIIVPSVEEEFRWISVDDFSLYRDAFFSTETGEKTSKNARLVFFKTDIRETKIPDEEILPSEILTPKYKTADARKKIIERFLRNHTVCNIENIVNRYPLEKVFVYDVLKEFEKTKDLINIPVTESSDSERWIFPDTLERIRRVSIRKQRSQIEPCDTAQFVKFLLKWQHRAEGAKLSDIDGLLQVLDKFQGLTLPAKIWENEIFGKRLKDYSPKWLDQLCQSGEILWFASGTGSSVKLNMTFLYRENLPFFHHIPKFNSTKKDESQSAGKIREALQARGACFVTDLSMETGLAPSQCLEGLWELVEQGEVSNDTFSVIRAGKKVNSTQKYSSISQNRFSRGGVQRIRPQRHHRPQTGSGRWFLIPYTEDTPNQSQENLESISRLLLHRYGLLCREIFDLEDLAIPWRSIYETLIRLEWRGEIKRGYFVKGLSGVQFALPAAADELLDLQKPKRKDKSTDEMILLNSRDPANLYGAASPLPLIHPLFHDWRFQRHANNFLILKNGLPILAIEARGRRLIPLRDLTSREKKEIVRLLPQLLDDQPGWRTVRSIQVETWDKTPVRNSEIAGYLKEMGFRDEFKVMVLERGY